MKTVASRDKVGTGHPVDYCYGQTDEFGKVKVGTRFTKKQCDEKLAESIPKYLDEVGPCIHRPIPTKAMSALVDGAYNAGSPGVCRSPMVKKINVGDIRGGCAAFAGWYITTKNDGKRKVVQGLIERRNGDDHGDPRKSEKGLCLDGLSQPKKDWYVYSKQPVQPVAPPTFWQKVSLWFRWIWK